MPSENNYSNTPRRILIIENDFAIVRHATRALAPNPVTAVKNLRHAREFLENQPYEVVLFDPHEHDHGLDFLLELARERPRVRRVVYTSSPEVERAFGLAHVTLHKPAVDADLRAAALSRSDSSEFRPIRS
jgi:DNA-binding NtrC family response regulator